MKFSRERLRTAIVAAIEADHKDHDAKQTNLENIYDAKAESWLDEYAEDWRRFAGQIVKKLDELEPITQYDLPRSRDRFRNSHTSVFDASRGTTPDWKVPAELSQLLAIIDSLDEDTISLYALKQLGFGQSAMHKVSSYLVGQP